MTRTVKFAAILAVILVTVACLTYVSWIWPVKPRVGGIEISFPAGGIGYLESEMEFTAGDPNSGYFRPKGGPWEFSWIGKTVWRLTK